MAISREKNWGSEGVRGCVTTWVTVEGSDFEAVFSLSPHPASSTAATTPATGSCLTRGHPTEGTSAKRVSQSASPVMDALSSPVCRPRAASRSRCRGR